MEFTLQLLCAVDYSSYDNRERASSFQFVYAFLNSGAREANLYEWTSVEEINNWRAFLRLCGARFGIASNGGSAAPCTRITRQSPDTPEHVRHKFRLCGATESFGDCIPASYSFGVPISFMVL